MGRSENKIRKMNAEKHDNRTGITLDAVLRTLATERRRAILAALADDNQDEMRLQRLVSEVVERLPDSRRPVLQRREEVCIDLAHAHLPKLDSHDIVEWDAESKVAIIGPEFERVMSVLTRIQAEDWTGQ